MAGDTNLSRETEQFSFIRTINVSSHQDDIETDLNLSASQNNSKDSQAQNVSALCRTSQKTKSSSLAINNSSTISDRWYSADNLNNDALSTVIILPETQLPNEPNKKGINSYLDRILLIIAGGYLCFVFWWLFGTKNAMYSLPFLPKQESISQADAEFIDYMKQSLEVIDRKVANRQLSSEKVADSQEKTSEVVYVPIYTPAPAVKPNSRIDLPQANSFLPPPPLPNQLAAMNPPVSAIPIKPPASPSESVKVKTTPTAPASETSKVESTSQKAINTETAVVTTKSNVNGALVGVMELEKGSAALFKINGVTQRIWLGDEIESTGWTLDSVANQKAKISFQGKTLTLNVGEKF